MKRVLQLRDLSEDHHRGLVLARKAKIAASGQKGPTGPEVWAEVEAVFKSELEPHFRIEESFIGEALKGAGESQLAQRLSDEHEARARHQCGGAYERHRILRRREPSHHDDERSVAPTTQALSSPEAIPVSSVR